jgi:phospholipase C
MSRVAADDTQRVTTAQSRSPTRRRTRAKNLGISEIDTAASIEHTFVLMMENRSFDHFLGDIPRVNGVDHNSPRSNKRPRVATPYVQKPDALRKLKPDPHHDAKNVRRQIQGEGLGRMGGFVYDFALEEPDSENVWPQVMSYFERGSLPALHELSTAFCVCDSWFSSVPGPTWPNRFFVHSGTSQGWVKMPEPPFHPNLHKYDQTTIYDRLNERDVKWRIYAGDIPQSLVLANLRSKENKKNFSLMKHFYSDIKNTDGGGFPKYVFIEPSYMPGGQNDQHPPHDVLKGDDLIASVYNALRANEKLWNKSLLILTWDEHGGFYDHVLPPSAVPPDHNDHEFDFKQYGVRVPTVLVSKWVKPGSVFRTTEGVFDHTSILAFLSDKYELGPLGARTAAAASFQEALTGVANEKSPLRVGTAPRPVAMARIDDASAPALNKNQAALIEFTKHLEVEMGSDALDVGRRAMQASTSVDGEIRAAKERVRLFLGQD